MNKYLCTYVNKYMCTYVNKYMCTSSRGKKLKFMTQTTHMLLQVCIRYRLPICDYKYVLEIT